MRLKRVVGLLIIVLLITTFLTNVEIKESQTVAPLQPGLSSFPMFSVTRNSGYFSSSFGYIYAELETVKDMQQWANINVNMELFNQKIIYYFDHIWVNQMRRNIQYLEFCSMKH